MLIICGIVAVLLIAIASVIWFTGFEKHSLIRKFETPENKTMYVLGTFHGLHYNKILRYSIEDILNVVKNIDPDTIYIEAREESYNEYGVVDGPIEMSVIYAYCKENNIAVEMIDWWVVDNEFKRSTTTKKRDDEIFKNIENKLISLEKDEVALVICGKTHLFEQKKRFLDSGYNELKIENKKELFKSNDIFSYPLSTKDVFEKKAYFYAYTYPEIIHSDITLNDSTKAQFNKNDEAFYKNQMNYISLFNENKLYK